MELLTPKDLWCGYEPSALPLALSLLSDKTVGGVREVCARINGSFAPDGVSRVFIRALVPDNPVASVVIVPDVSVNVHEVNADSYTRLGYAVIIPDYAGARDETPDFTLYPRSLSRANFVKETLRTLPSSPRNNCWVIWAEGVMRAITFAREFVGVEKIAVLGEGVAVPTVIKVAAIDKRVTCAVTTYSSGFSPCGNEAENMQYKVSLSDESYMSLLLCPLLMQIASNEEDGSFDNMSSAFDLVENDSLLAVSACTSHALEFKQRGNSDAFLAYYLKGEGELPASPEIRGYCENRSLFFAVKTASDDVVLYVAQGETSGALRNWRRYKGERVGDEVVFKVEVSDTRMPVRAFANVTQGMTVSTNVICKLPAMLGVQEVKRESSRLIYDGAFGVDEWLALSHAGGEDAVNVKTGPFGISGVSSDVGTMSTFKIGDATFRGSGNMMLQIMMYSTADQDVTLSITAKSGEEYCEYTHVESMCESDNWKKITLTKADFRSALSGGCVWEKAVRLKIDSVSPVIISSILWI